MSGSQQLLGVDRGAAELAGRVAPSVVEIRAGHGTGAGTIWRTYGLIVTNEHVVPADHADVRMSDGRSFQGRVVARDLENDLAVLTVGQAGLPAVDVRVRPIRPGEIVLAIGHPFGLRYTVSLGIVSTARMQLEGIERPLIRADVPIGPGNSGGPLVDAAGRVVGINAMIGGGLALAVPSYLAEGLVQAVVGRAAA